MASKEKYTLSPPIIAKYEATDDIRVIGINSVLADYKLVWQLNEQLSIKLTRQDDLVHGDGIYPYYHCSAEENGPSYGFLAVSYDKQSILNFKPRLDYLFIIRHESLPMRINTMFEKIKALKGVNYAFLMDGYMDRLEGALYDVENYEDTVLIPKLRWLNSPEHAKEEIRQRNLILGISND